MFDRKLDSLRRRAVWLAILCVFANPAPAQTYRYASTIGTSGPGKLTYPGEVQVDARSHYLLVGDGGNKRIAVFNQAGTFLYAMGSAGIGDGQFSAPSGIAIDPSSHNVFVGDYYAGRVQEFSAAGTYLSQFGAGNIPNPCGVAVLQGSHNVLVSTGFAATVGIYTQAGSPVGGFGSSANFGYACDIAIAPNGNILVSDETNTNVQVFSGAGAPLFAFGGAGNGDGQFAAPSPTGLAVDPLNGDVVVADYGNDRIEIFDSAGHYLSQFGSTGTQPGQFEGPFGVAIDPATRNLFIADRSNDRVQVFTSCGPTLVALSILPLTQQVNQATFFSVSIGNVVHPGGLVSIYGDDGSLICSAATYGDPQASCSGFLQLGVHTASASWSGDGLNPSGCSSPQTVAVVTNLTPTGTTLDLVGPPNGINEGYVFTLDANVTPPSGRGTQAASAPSGFVTFFDGSNVLDYVPLNGSHAVYSNRISGGTHNFSATYSGDGTYASGSANAPVDASVPSDELYYDSFEVGPGA